MTPQQAHFDELYAAFFAFYQGAIRKSDAPHEKIRLSLTTQFFTDPELLKRVQPLFSKFSTTVDEKRAVARQAYLDAWSIHNRTTGFVWEPVTEKERNKFLQDQRQ